MKKNEEKFIWSILLHLGYRMWGDDNSLKPMPDTLAFDYDILHAIDLVGQSMLI